MLQFPSVSEEEFEHFSVGDLVSLPRELFIVPETTPYRPKYECF